MERRLGDIEQLATRKNQFVDCYFSSNELSCILEPLGFEDNYSGTERQTLSDLYGDYRYEELLIHSKTGLEIDCVEIPIEEALKVSKEIGFMPMSKFRVYINGSKNAIKILHPMIKALNEERQNMAFISDNGSLVYRQLSEFYI